MSEPLTWVDDIVPEYATIEGHFVGISYDSADENLTPDVQPLDGTVRLVPTVTAGRLSDAIAHILPVDARVFGGQIVDDLDMPGVRVLSTDSDVGVTDWAWTAHFTLDSGLAVMPITFKAPTGTVVSLTDGLIPVESVPYQVVGGPQGASVVTAEDQGDGTMVFVLSDGTRTAPVPWVTGPAGPAATWDTLTGRPAATNLATPNALVQRDVNGGASLSYLEMAPGYAPVDPGDVATKEYVDSPAQDSGARSMITPWSGVTNSPTWHAVRLRRVGNLVALEFWATPANTNLATCPIPTGFTRPTGSVLSPILQMSGSAVQLGALSYLSGTSSFYFKGANTTTAHYGSTSWVTTDPWPETLPGSPA